MTQQNSSQFWIMGPTASGKSALSYQFAEQTKAEIISVDSALVYQGLDIGSAKPTKHQQQKVAHHLIDICKPWEIYDVARFCQDCKRVTGAIVSKKENANKPIVLTGGTFLYFRSLEKGLSKLPKSDKTIQQKWQKRANQIGSEQLFQELKKVDCQTAKKLHPNDSQRIIRALVVFEQTSLPLSQLIANDNLQMQINTTKSDQNQSAPIKIALLPDREELKVRIKERFFQMLDFGFINEVEKLLIQFEKQGIEEQDFFSYPSLKSIGYRQVCQYLLGDLNFDQMVEKAIIASNQLAKRQRTWLRAEKNITIFNCREQAMEFLKQSYRLNEINLNR